ITVTVSDGQLASSGSFVLTVVPSGQAAVYDSTLQAPKCDVVGNSCQSGTLLVGRDTMNGGVEPHEPRIVFGWCGSTPAEHNPGLVRGRRAGRLPFRRIGSRPARRPR